MPAGRDIRTITLLRGEELRVVALRGSTPPSASLEECATRSAVSGDVNPTPRCGLCRMARRKRPRVSVADMSAATE